MKEKEVCHVWELGGNSTAFSELTSIVLTQQRLPTNVVVLVLDLSKPSDSLASGARWLGILRQKTQEIVDRMAKAAAAGKKAGAGGAAGSAAGSDVDHIRAVAALRRRVGWAQRTGATVQVAFPEPPSATSTKGSASSSSSSSSSSEPPQPQPRPLVDLRGPAIPSHASAAILAAVADHPDAKLLEKTALPCQLLVVGHKAEALREADSAKKKAVLCALRYLAHCHGGALVTTSSRDKTSLASFRGILGSLAFGSETRRAAQMDLARPLYIPAGSDSVETIGIPLAVSGQPPSTKLDVENAASSFDARFDRYLASVKAFFPTLGPVAGPANPSPEFEEVDPSTVLPAPSAMAPGAGTSIVFNDEASKAPEPLIDSLRLQKAEEAARYAKEAERRLRLEAKAAASSSSSSSGSGGAAGGSGRD